eukprot:Nk52_evm8s216 gene=Nk52_evmTU8s216
MNHQGHVYDCLVVGAGPGGLVTCKELVYEQMLDNVLVLERGQDIGGVFNAQNRYEGLTLTSSCAFSMFSDFPPDGMEKEGPDRRQSLGGFWTAEEVVEYWRRYSKHYGVWEKIRFGRRVERVKWVHKKGSEGCWRVWYSDDALGGVAWTRRIVMATGGNQIPKYPEWALKGLQGGGDWEEKKEEGLGRGGRRISVRHSSEFKGAEEDGYAGKRVLIVGGGESASDIALAVARVAESVTVNIRSSTGWVIPRKRGDMAADIATHRGLYWLPRSYGAELGQQLISSEVHRTESVAGKGTHDTRVSEAIVYLNGLVSNKNRVWGTYGTKTASLPEAMVRYGCRVVVGEICRYDERKGVFEVEGGDNIAATDVDVIICCTGFKPSLPFPVEDEHPKGDSQTRIAPREMFRHMFDCRYGSSLAWVGYARPAIGSQFPIMEMQARYYALVAAGKLSLPSLDEMKKDIVLWKKCNEEQFGLHATSIPTLVDYLHYMDGMASLVECQPPLMHLLLTQPMLWYRIVYGPIQASQYRFVGPGKKPALATAILKDMPVAPVTSPVVQAGLKGSLRWFFSRSFFSS